MKKLLFLAFVMPLVMCAAVSTSSCGGNMPSGGCCKVCKNSQPCGDSCISSGSTCHMGGGCACSG